MTVKIGMQVHFNGIQGHWRDGHADAWRKSVCACDGAQTLGSRDTNQ